MKQRVSAGAPTPMGEAAAAIRDALILIVDDDPNIREVLADILEGEGYATAQASHGGEALTFLEGLLPAAILLDMRMPIMDGWRFAEAYRRRPAPRAPIVMMSAAHDARKWSNEIHAEACLSKPFEYDDLVDTLADVQRREPSHVTATG